MLKSHHAIAFTIIVVVTAAVSAFAVHSILSRLLPTTPFEPRKQNSSQSIFDAPSASLPKDQFGTYILPTVDPTYPIRPGSGTVEGNSGCERLDNLRSCLLSHSSSLVSLVNPPIPRRSRQERAWSLVAQKFSRTSNQSV